MQALPIGIQSFADLRRDGYLYVDKTSDIHRMISSGKVFFLSRPRRFGKSLLISTLDALFQGKKELFDGLYIADKWDWNQQYPVIRLDWSNIQHTSLEVMEEGMAIYLKEIAGNCEIMLEQSTASNRLGELIRRLHQKTGKQVVVLVDEYDMPILDALNKPPEQVDAMRAFLQGFYRIFKGEGEHLRFIFLTGVSKFAKVSIFSGLNNLNDISLDAEYAALCGYTQAELEAYFEPFIGEMALKEKTSPQDILARIKHWYNGFSWDGVTSVYNPFSSLLLFSKKVFRDYWFESGSPTFLIKLIKERNDVQFLLEPVQMKDTSFNSFDPHTLETQLLLFQTGYLTVKQVEKSPFSARLNYTLGIPNEEVRSSLMEYLVGSFASYPVGDVPLARERMMQQLFDGDISGFDASMKELFARIPYQLHLPFEAYYHSLFLLWLNLLGFTVEAEVSTDKGRIDAVWTWEDRVVIAELKFSADGTVEPLLKNALTQIRERRYHERYAGSHRRIALLAIAFAGKEIACRLTELVCS